MSLKDKRDKRKIVWKRYQFSQQCHLVSGGGRCGKDKILRRHAFALGKTQRTHKALKHSA